MLGRGAKGLVNEFRVLLCRKEWWQPGKRSKPVAAVSRCSPSYIKKAALALTQFPPGNTLAKSEPGPPHPLRPQLQDQNLAIPVALGQHLGDYDNGVALRHGLRDLHSSKLDFENIEIEGPAIGKAKVRHEWFPIAE